MQTQATGSRVAILGGARTPFAKALTALRGRSALDLAVHSVDGLLEKQELDPASVDELVYGITVLEPRLPQFAREVVFSSRLPSQVKRPLETPDRSPDRSQKSPCSSFRNDCGR